MTGEEFFQADPVKNPPPATAEVVRDYRLAVNRRLLTLSDVYYGNQRTDGAEGNPDTLFAACRYALNLPGKRLRPVLYLTAYAALGEDVDSAALDTASALEFVHTYSLVHDDLPCMDDDDVRRGMPTVHRAFDEATAVLCGDALLTDAFHIVASRSRASHVSALVRELAGASGGRGMILGQALDLHWTGRVGATWADLEGLHRLKTGYLFGAALAMAGIAADAGEPTINALRHLGHDIGLAYQVVDDLLDDGDTTGKTSGKDLRDGKSTAVAILGRTGAEDFARELRESIVRTLANLPLPSPSNHLGVLVAQLLSRT